MVREGEHIGAEAAFLKYTKLELVYITPEQPLIVEEPLTVLAGAAPSSVSVLVHGIGVVPDFDQAGIGHFTDMLPGDVAVVNVLVEVIAPYIGMVADDVDYCFHVVPFQKRESVNIVVVVSVIKGEHNRIRGERFVVVDKLKQLTHSDCVEFVLLEEFQVSFKFLF